MTAASLFARAQFRRDLAAAGAEYPGNKKLFEALRADLAAAAPANLDDLLSLVDLADSETGDMDPDIRRDFEAAARLARAMGGEYAGMEGARVYFLEVAPICAARICLTGWDGIAAPFERRNGVATDAALRRLTAADLKAVGERSLGLLFLDEAATKNSESPSPSRGGPEISTPDGMSPPTAAPVGTLPAPSTPEIQPA